MRSRAVRRPFSSALCTALVQRCASSWPRRGPRESGIDRSTEIYRAEPPRTYTRHMLISVEYVLLDLYLVLDLVRSTRGILLVITIHNLPVVTCITISVLAGIVHNTAGNCCRVYKDSYSVRPRAGPRGAANLGISSLVPGTSNDTPRIPCTA